jgi:hypothetical protein
MSDWWPWIWAATMVGWVVTNCRLIALNAKWRELFDRLLNDRREL